MFAGLVDDIEKFPNIDIIIESILYCNSNSNRIIWIIKIVIFSLNYCNLLFILISFSLDNKRIYNFNKKS